MFIKKSLLNIYISLSYFLILRFLRKVKLKLLYYPPVFIFILNFRHIDHQNIIVQHNKDFHFILLHENQNLLWINCKNYYFFLYYFKFIV